MHPGRPRTATARRPGIPFAQFLPALLLLGAPCTAAAQAISGRVLDATSGVPLRNAFVEVFRDTDARIGAALTDGGGRFQIDLRGVDGPVRILINSLSHQGAVLDAERIDAEGFLDVGDIRLVEAPIALQGFEVRGQRSRITLGREAIRRHQLLGAGTFIPGAILTSRAPSSLTAFLSEASDLWVRVGPEPGPGTLRNPQSSTGYDCVVVMVNRWPLNRPGIAPGDPPLGFRDLDDIPLEWIGGIEVFNDYNDVPDLYLSDAILGANAGIPQYCGFVNIWLWNSWF